ncbi:MAG: hypothetical protein RsTaC01_0289 [Candidatus Paraimprobicoccus trichonymphae]|uniref:Uncharacterized protein n=1 Tax=Candidatus Paraimprobicoccus trichonymphae TaxID=3033793 RepID=A0AA48HW90_9FIRM|nr:MAG: hypothetical protein RsTaC01_0289 [Candidatus Paraimprobicoccus trichonymphae]
MKKNLRLKSVLISMVLLGSSLGLKANKVKNITNVVASSVIVAGTVGLKIAANAMYVSTSGGNNNYNTFSKCFLAHNTAFEWVANIVAPIVILLPGLTFLGNSIRSLITEQ